MLILLCKLYYDNKIMITNTKEKYLKENLIAYIGNKRRLLPFIENTILSILDEDKSIKTALDLFAGSGSVSRLLKTLNLEVYSNDWEYYSYILNYAHLEINIEDLDNMFIHTGGLENTIRMINNITSINDSDRYISKYYAPLDDDNPDLLNERLFYTQYNAARIDIIRHNIEELYKNNAINQKEYYYLLASIIYEAATHTNTSVVFKGFHAGFGGRNKDALNRILAEISLNEIPLYSGKKCYASMLDANDFVLKNKNKHFDLVYLDPPYNQHQYGSNYHLLNTIALWDKPPINIDIYINGKKTDKSGIRKDWVKTKSLYCYKKTAKDTLINYLYSDTEQTERATDSMRFYVLLPAKFESKLGAIYFYVMPRLMFEGSIYKTDGIYNLHYGMEGELQLTLIENLTFGLTAYAEGQYIARKNADFNINNAFGGGLDVWGIWRY